MRWVMKRKTESISKDLDVNLEFIRKALGADVSFDIIIREFRVARKRAALVFVDGFVKDEVLVHVMNAMQVAGREELLPGLLDRLRSDRLNYIEIDTKDSLNDLIREVLAGPLALLVEGERQALIIDARTYPTRAADEPDLERVTRGSRDGFVETLVFNTALIRRRIRDPRLRNVLLQVGKRSATDVVVSYIEDIADPGLVEDILTRLKGIEIDGVPMAEKTVEEFLEPSRRWWNPFPVVRFTERPDVAAIHLLEGHILVMVDTSPSVIILPATFFHHLQHAEEYRQDVAVGFYLRWVRFFGVFVSWLLPPLWVALTMRPDLLPSALDFIGPKGTAPIPLPIQFLFAELGVDLIRLALIHTPNALATSLGIIGAVLLGQLAVETGVLQNEAILYIAVGALGTFATPSMELGMAIRLMRILLLIAVALFGLVGFAVAFLANLALLLFTKSFGVPYLWPLIPLDLRALQDILILRPAPTKGRRIPVLNPRDPDRLPGTGGGGI